MTHPVTVSYVPGRDEQVITWMEANKIYNYNLAVHHNYDTGRSTMRIDFEHRENAVQFTLAWTDILV